MTGTINARVAVNEIELHIAGTGPQTVVMLHGWPDTYRLWDAQVAALQNHYRCVRFTLPGFDTETRKAYSLDEIVTALKNVVEQVSPGQPVILLLHDWGCFFGYQFALRYPELVAKIVGVDVGDMRGLQKELSPQESLILVGYQWLLALAWSVGGSFGNAVTRAMTGLLGCPTDPAAVHVNMNYPYFMFWAGGKQSYRRHTRAFFPSCPMLFIYGRRKPTRFHTVAWLNKLRAVPGNQVTEFETGHWVMLSQPERFNQVVQGWLAL